MKVLKRVICAAEGYYEKQSKKILTKYKDLPKDVIFCIESYSQSLDEKDETIKEQLKEIDKLKKEIKSKEDAYQKLERQYHSK